MSELRNEQGTEQPKHACHPYVDVERKTKSIMVYYSHMHASTSLEILYYNLNIWENYYFLILYLQRS